MPFYFIAKGMWRKGLAFLAAAFVLGAILGFLGLADNDSLMRAIGIGFSVAASMTANYAYYLHVRRGSTSWNPYEGFGRPKQPQPGPPTPYGTP